MSGFQAPNSPPKVGLEDYLFNGVHLENPPVAETPLSPVDVWQVTQPGTQSPPPPNVSDAGSFGDKRQLQVEFDSQDEIDPIYAMTFEAARQPDWYLPTKLVAFPPHPMGEGAVICDLVHDQTCVDRDGIGFVHSHDFTGNLVCLPVSPTVAASLRRETKRVMSIGSLYATSAESAQLPDYNPFLVKRDTMSYPEVLRASNTFLKKILALKA